MNTRWEVERAVFASDLKAAGRHIALTLLAMSDPKTCVIPAEYTPSLSRLERMTGLSLSSIKRELNALEKTGWVVRSRPDMAKARAEKERTRYRLDIPGARPTQGLADPEWPPMSRPTETLARPTQGLELGPQGATGLGPQWATSQTFSQTINQTSGSSPERFVADVVGASPEEAACLIKRIKKDKDPQNLAGFVRHMAKTGDLASLLEEIRNVERLRFIEAELSRIRRGPECVHRQPGGAMPHPASGALMCPLCRRTAQSNGRVSA